MKFAGVNATVRGWIGLGIRIVLAVLWGWAAWSKIVEPRRFVQAVRAYDATPEWLSKAIGYGLPMLELTLGILLLIGLITRYAAVASALLFVVFLVGVVQAATRGLKIECGCFGGGGATDKTQYPLEILRDLGLFALAVYLVLWPRTRFSVDQAIISSELVPGLTAKQQKSEKNVRRYRAAVAAAERELRHKQRYIAVGTAVVVVLVSFIAIGVQSGRAKISGTVDTANASAKTGVRVGNQRAPVTLDVYEDPQCPVCAGLEQSGLATDLAAKVKATSIKINYHIESFLDGASSGNKYSSRAANALYCAADTSPDVFVKLHDIMFGKDSSGKNNQPAENSNGRPDSVLLAWGKQAGITSADFSTCVTSKQHANLVAAATDAVSRAGITGTPSVAVNGTRIGGDNAMPTVGQVDSAIADALSKSKSSAAPSPTAASPTAPSGTASSGKSSGTPATNAKPSTAAPKTSSTKP